MNGFMILYIVTVAIVLYLWAITQSQSNNTFEKMKEGFNLFKDALKTHTELDKKVEERVSKLEKKVEALEKKQVLGYLSPFTIVQDIEAKREMERKINAERIEFSKPKPTTMIQIGTFQTTTNDTNDKEPNIPGLVTNANPGNKPTPDHITIGEIADRYNETPDHKTHGDPMK